ncbi:hypothetical protein PENTCL1PPCAC_14924 [Pristionchus entomophagus]|uniref:Saposin B-type domain-containing protein n=1 Tax=Pristionchus entomophagus TaxID=358040 RepID=A0AAV5TBS5_9BILA|nr:hypothetical protein PENTCL1PPCAC_14924 [Pristionchus entomophagus]
MQRALLAASLCALMIASLAVQPAVPETRKAFCSACMNIVKAMESGFESHEPNILQHCENLCDDLLGHMGNLAQECKDWIDKDFGEIMDKLTYGSWTPNAICQDYHLC